MGRETFDKGNHPGIRNPSKTGIALLNPVYLSMTPKLFSDAEIRNEVKFIYYTKQRSGFVKEKGLGLIHIYHGQGVRKTSSAVGLALRAAGNDLQVDFIQFMKSGDSGEVAIIRDIPNIRYHCPGKHPFIMSSGPDPVHYAHAEKGLKLAWEAVEGGTHFLICDEMLDTIIFELLKKNQIMDLMKRCKNRVEMVMTGRHAPSEFIGFADYVTEFMQIKHAYYEGARARKGIEY